MAFWAAPSAQPHDKPSAAAICSPVHGRSLVVRSVSRLATAALMAMLFAAPGTVHARDRTIASAYSIRPTMDARASAPLRWEEVPECDPAEFTLTTMRERIDKVGDLTAGMWRRKVSLLPKFKRLNLEAPAP